VYTYFYTRPVGGGVDIYVIDTGVYIEHSEFERRGSWGFVGRGLPQEDDNGHGTHVAGIAAGRKFGVAKNANIIAVKVLDTSGFTTMDDCIDGINWVTGQAKRTGKLSIALMAFSVGRRRAINDAATTLYFSGVTVVAAAGNTGSYAERMSPGSAAGVITVGSSNILNIMTPSSNIGATVNVFAPGEFIIAAAAMGGPTDTGVRSGTSMAAAHVAGIAASILSMNPTLKPFRLLQKIEDISTRGVITGVPGGKGTPTDLAFNGYNIV